MFWMSVLSGLCRWIFPFLFAIGAWVLFLEHRISLSLGADLKVVLTPPLCNMGLSWCAIYGMYLMHTYDFCSLSLRFLFVDGSMSKRFLLLNSSVVLYCLSCLFFWGSFSVFCLICWLALILHLKKNWAIFLARFNGTTFNSLSPTDLMQIRF